MAEYDQERAPKKSATVTNAAVEWRALQAQLQSVEEQLRAVEQALRASEERFTLITDGVNGGSWDWDVAAGSMHMSPRLLALIPATGNTADISFEQWADLIHPAERAEVVESLQRYALNPSEQPWEREYRLFRRDGTCDWVVSRGVAVLDSDGRVSGVVAALNDISVRHRAEEQLRRSEALYRALAENFPRGAVLLFDRNLRYLVADGGGLADVGLSRDALVGKTLWEAIAPNTAATVEPAYHAALRGQASSLTVPYLDREYDVHVVPITDDRGDVALGMLVGLDITERQNSERALRESEAKFRALAETVAAAIFIFQGVRLCYVNQTAVTITGYTREELETMQFWELIHPDFRELVRTRGLTRQTGAPVLPRYEVKIVAKSGEERWVDFSAGVIEYDGAPAVLGTAFDVTERRHAEDTLRRREVELAHVSRVRIMGEMTAAFAHELNQPLAAIVSYAKGCIRRVRSGAALTDDLVDALEQVAQQGVRAGEIIRRLRRFVRKGDSRRKPVDLNGVVREALSFVEPEARRQAIVLRVELAGDLPPVEADDIQIEQVVLNLIRNACEAVRASPDSVAEVTVTTERHDGAIEVAVSDGGEGIAPEMLETVFDAFFSTRPEGMGMGLSISRSIVESHGGRLWAAPNLGGGAVFRFRLPTRTPVGAARGEGN